LQRQWFHPQDHLLEYALGYSQEFFSDEGGQMVFICRYLPANEKNLSLCSLRLCGEPWSPLMRDKRAVIFNSPLPARKA
jgi:hypothetical protein